MANIDISGAPYYDRFTASKNYNKLLFNPDRPLQQSELIELQSILEHYLRTAGDAIFSDGDIISGLDFDITDSAEGRKLVNIHEGLIYLDGKVRQLTGNIVTLNGVGTETIGAHVRQTKISYIDDPTLLDPTIGAPSESSQGADRLKEEVVLEANNPDATEVYRFEDGKLFVNRNSSSSLSKVLDILAERTFDESGSYRVNGFELYTDETQETQDSVSLMVSSGRAYVQGYKVEKPSASRIAIPKSLDTREVIDETTTYHDTVSEAKHQKVRLNNRPVADIRSVTAPVFVSSQVARSGSQQYDNLPNSNIVAITKVTTSKGVASQGTDYQLENGNRIRWVIGSSKAPVSGETYNVQYNYMKLMVKGVDYNLVENKEELDFNGYPTYYVSFNGLTGSKPVDGEMVHTTYTYYLARKDLITVDSDGKFTVISGQPDVLDSVTPPSNNDPLTLELGTITVFPNSLVSRVNSNTVTNIPFESLQKIVARVGTLEYNVANLSMDTYAKQGYDPTTLRGIFADSFSTTDKLDTGLEGQLENGEPIQYVSFGFKDAEITLPFKSQKDNTMTMLPSSDLDATFKSNTWGRIVTAPYKKVAIISQQLATGVMNVNPYLVYDSAEGVLSLNPSNDSWVDTENVIINNKKTTTSRISALWWRGNENFANSDSSFIQKNQDSITWDGGKGVGASGSNFSGTLVENVGTNTIDTIIEFMRSRDVKISAQGLRPFADNLYLVFNGIKLDLKVGAVGSKGTKEGTLKADGKGSVEGSFTVPAGQRCGTVNVELKNDEPVGSSSASTVYTAHGTHRVVENIINTTRITVTLYDPLAQSFQVQENRILSGAGLYFNSKDEVAPIIVQLRGMSDGGQPNNVIYAEKVLQPSEIKVSEFGTEETVVTFDDPVMAKAMDTFALVIITESSNYNMYIAKMGQTFIDNADEKLRSQAYPKGVLFSSSNAQTWTAHQDSDLKFHIYATEFKPGDATVMFTPIKDIPNMDKLLIVASYLTPANTGCRWEVRYVLADEDVSVAIDSKPWRPTTSFSDIEGGALIREAQLRATFTANKYMSPMFALDDFSLMSFLTATKGSYIGKTVDMTGAEFNTIDTSYSQYIPNTQCKVTPKYHLGETNPDGTLKWETLETLKTAGATVSTKTTAPDANGFTIVTHTVKMTGAKKTFKVRLDLTSPTPVLRPRVKNLRNTMITT